MISQQFKKNNFYRSSNQLEKEKLIIIFLITLYTFLRYTLYENNIPHQKIIAIIGVSLSLFSIMAHQIINNNNIDETNEVLNKKMES